VGGARHRQELRQPLDDTEQHGFDEDHGVWARTG
jgi:hypothetical protein